MKIFIASSKHFYDQIEDIAKRLNEMGHELIFPNCYEDPMEEERIKMEDPNNHSDWKQEMFRSQNKKVQDSDAVLVLNFEKKGINNYVGGSVFLEMFKAWELGKKLFLFNEIPENMLKDEIQGFNPTIINGDLSKLK